MDPDGNPRTLGAAPDIGAFEFVPPAPPPAPPAPTPATPAADTAAPAITLAGLPRRVTASALRKGVKVRVATSEEARLALTLTARRRGGAFLSATRKPKTTTVTLGRASAPAGGQARTVTIKASRKALGRATRLKATLTVVATDAAGNAARRTATLAVAPARRR